MLQLWKSVGCVFYRPVVLIIFRIKIVMVEEENEVDEDGVVPGSKPDFLAGDSLDLGDDDLGISDEDDSLSLSFGGSRGFEE